MPHFTFLLYCKAENIALMLENDNLLHCKASLRRNDIEIFCLFVYTCLYNFLA